MLDAIGAVGIARCFTFGGAKNRPLYDPETVANLSVLSPTRVSSAEYTKNGRENKSTVDHFYEKLLHVKSLLQTDAGRRIAEQRHELMEHFLVQLTKEILGES